MLDSRRKVVCGPEVVEIAIGINGLGMVVAAEERGRRVCSYTWEMYLQTAFCNQHREADVMLIGHGMRHAANLDLDGGRVEQIHFGYVLVAHGHLVVGCVGGKQLHLFATTSGNNARINELDDDIPANGTSIHVEFHDK